MNTFPQQSVPWAGVGALLAADLLVGVARGNSEFGPRALGHRSLLAYPADAKVKARGLTRHSCPVSTAERRMQSPADAKLLTPAAER